MGKTKRKARLVFLAVAASAIVAPAVALGQTTGFNLDQYRAAETPEDGFAVSRPNDLGHLRVGAHLHLDYAYNPLVWETNQGERDTELGAVVEHMLVGTLGAALGLVDRLVIYVGLPVNLAMVAEENLIVDERVAADGATIGDLYLGARVRVVGDDDDFFSLGFQGTLTMPMGHWAHDGAWAGERNFTGHLEVLAEIRPGPVRVTANLGARFRESADYVSFVSGHDLTWGLAGAWRVVEMFEILLELYGSTTFAEFGNRENTPFEAIAGARLYPGRGFVIGLAGGGGMIRGVGSPDGRVVLTFGWARPAPAAPEPEPVPIPEPDCPDPDGDGICGDADQCPNEPEDRDEFEDDDGCPDPDNDQDGVLDTNDRCPNEPEDRDGFADEDGCPDPDNDQDTIIDPDDQCPIAPGPPETNGCPRTIRVEAGQIVILQQIQFDTDRDTLRPSAIPILDEVLAVLRANPQIRRVRIEGHTDSRQTDAYNLDLSQRRARTVVEWLVERGIDRSRLEPAGFGESRPIDTNDTTTGRFNNRRVEFHIVDPAPPPGGDGRRIETPR